MRTNDNQGNVKFNNFQEKAGYFSCVDECHLINEQSLMKFSMATLKAKLTCFDVGHNYIAFGSGCGTLFLFNRRLNHSTAPLQTNVDDLISCVKLFSGEHDLLAAGDCSGGLTLLNFSTENSDSIKRLEQNLQLSGHKGHPVSCIAWAEDGRKVFSADSAGTVFVTSVNYIRNVFQTTFVCFEKSYVMQLTHLCNLVALCTNKRVAVIDDGFFNSMLEIDQQQQKAIGIHLIAKTFGTELLILQSDGSIIVYDIFRGQKKRSFSVSKDIMRKLDSTSFSNESRPRQWRSCMLSVHSEILIVYFYNYIVLLNFEDQTTLSLFDVGAVFHDRTFQSCVCVDPRSSLLSIYVLGPDSRVVRLSLNDILSNPTETPEVLEKFTLNTSLTPFKKNSKLLPNVSKNAFWDGLKVAKEMNVFSALRNFSVPTLNAVSDFKTILHKYSRNSICYQSSDSDSRGNKSSITVSQNKNNISKHLEQMLIQPANVIENLNKVAQTLVDRVGGFGTQVEDGFLVQPICDANIVDVEKSLFPAEQTGILQEIMVRRTKTTPTSKRKKAERVSGFRRSSLMNLSKEDVSCVDEETLENSKGALTIRLSYCELDFHSLNDFRGGEIEYVADCSEEDQKVVLCSELNGGLDTKSENLDPVKEQSLEVNSINSRPELLGDSNAYEFLMKDALERKLSVCEGATSIAVYCSHDEQVNKGIIVMNNFGDIWNEIKLPYSCSSFSVSSQYIIICHSKKKRKPYYLPIPYCGTVQWIKLKQKADQFIVNDDGSLIWKIFKNVAYAPVEDSSGSCSYLTAFHWTVIADQGGGIIEVALTSRSAWYITKSGEVFVQLCLPEMGILSRCDVSWPLHSITASELAIWAIQINSGRLVVRTGLKYSPVGLDWVEVVPYGPGRLISICLFGQSGWAIDEKRLLWFTNGVGYQSPFGCTGSWMKVYNPWDVSPDINRLLTLEWVIRVSSAGVFICVDNRCYCSCGASVISGHRLEHVVRNNLSMDNNFELIAGGGFKEDFDCVTLCRIGEIFLYRLKNSYFYSLPAFPASFSSSVVEIWSFEENVYVLDSSGCIYVKENISPVSPFGVDWKILDTGPCGSPVTSFTVTSVSLWVVTAANETYLYVKGERKEPFIGTNPKWIHVKTLAGCLFEKIRASWNGMYVWIFSKNTGRAWARNSITDALPSGKSWTEANNEPGIYDLAVGCKIIWSLSASGQLHTLQGLAANNRAGNYWRPIPLKLKAITMDRKERLWGIDLEKRLAELYPPSVITS